MPKRKEPELDPKEQKKRFEALAREVGADRPKDVDLKKVLKQIALARSDKAQKRPK